jgi:hypothetical protein
MASLSPAVNLNGCERGVNRLLAARSGDAVGVNALNVPEPTRAHTNGAGRRLKKRDRAICPAFLQKGWGTTSSGRGG